MSAVRVLNRLVAWLARRGISISGSRELAVRGRISGQWRTVPVNLLHHAGTDYLLAPRGETEWVRNLRKAQSGQLRLGQRSVPFTAVEITDIAAKEPLLRAYLRRWKWQVSDFFPGLSADSTADELQRVAAKYPTFALTVSGAPGALPLQDARESNL